MLVLRSLTMDAADPDRLGRFWGRLLERRPVADAGGVLVAGSLGQVGLRFVPGDPGPHGPNRMHLHLTSADADQQRATVDRVLALGGSHLDVGQRPEEGHVVLADPEGNELCVIEPGNRFLAGCGFLGEVACDGSRDVGVFWSAALSWPLVWDHEQETAVQSPEGGTKVAWGGPPLMPKDGRNRQRLELETSYDEQAAEIDRLCALGAVRLSGGVGAGVSAGPGAGPGADAAAGGVVEMADPDGNEFCVRVG